MRNIWVAIVDDHLLFTSFMAHVLNDLRGISVVLTAKDGVDFFEKLKKTDKKPDVVLMDIEMPKMDGLKATKKLRKNYPEIKVIIVTMHTDDSFILALIESGADGYLFKNAEPKELEKAIVSVREGEKHFNKEALYAISTNMVRNKNVKNRLTKKGIALSNRETQVLELLCEAKNTREISEALNISVRTVESHRQNLLLKTESKNATALIIYALSHDLAPLKRDPLL